MKRLIITGTLLVGLVLLSGCGAHFGLTWMNSYPIIDINLGDANFKNHAPEPKPIIIYYVPRPDDTAETTVIIPQYGTPQEE